jgi:hypothetical protein
MVKLKMSSLLKFQTVDQEICLLRVKTLKNILDLVLNRENKNIKAAICWSVGLNQSVLSGPVC